MSSNQIMDVNERLITAENITIHKVRGKYVISSMPTEWIFGQENTLLECHKCMQDATWRGVLIGPCVDCSVIYQGAPVGFFEKEYAHAMPAGSSAAPFGFYSGYGRDVCRQIDALMPEDLHIPPVAYPVKHDDAYSFYGIAELGNYTADTSYLLESVYGQDIINRRYKCDSSDDGDERWFSITSLWGKLAEEFDQHSLPFYKKCEKMEKAWTQCVSATTQAEVDSEMAQKKIDKNKMHDCHYCGNMAVTMLCGACKAVRYCSVACQHRDWTKGGAYMCSDGQPSDPHKANCAYLTGIRTAQAEYEAMMRIAVEDENENEVEDEIEDEIATSDEDIYSID